MDLQTRFPVTFSKSDDHAKKYRKHAPNMITLYGITYDRSLLPTLSDNEIEQFANLQLEYPEIINNCFDNLIEILEQCERKIIIGIEESKNTPMNKIYKLLEGLNVHNNDMMMIDKWVLFIKSQDKFGTFFF